MLVLPSVKWEHQHLPTCYCSCEGKLSSGWCWIWTTVRGQRVAAVAASVDGHWTQGGGERSLCVLIVWGALSPLTEPQFCSSQTVGRFSLGMGHGVFPGQMSGALKCCRVSQLLGISRALSVASH